MNAGKRTIRVLIVDDSAFMRRAIARMIEKEDGLEVIASAASGEEAVAMTMQLRPDVITMDVEMPGMGGLEAARTIIERQGPPIIMISALTRDGAETTLRALEIGAVDFIPKPDSAYIDILTVQRDLADRLRLFGQRGAYLREMQGQAFSGPATPSAVLPRAARPAAGPFVAPPAPPAARPAGSRSRAFECVALGTSTGGPVALSQILPRLPADFPIPIVIVQHMPPGFTRPLAERLNGASRVTVVEAEEGHTLEPRTVYVAPAGRQLTLRREGSAVRISLREELGKSLHVPSVDVMAASVGEVYGAAALGVILTGMGHDGVEGLKTIKSRGGYVLGQDEASSIVYGMPRAAAVAGLVDRVVPLHDVARVLCESVGVAGALG